MLGDDSCPSHIEVEPLPISSRPKGVRPAAVQGLASHRGTGDDNPSNHPDTLAFVLLCDDAEVVMRYVAAWILGVPVSLIALWFVVGHMGCGH